MLKNLGSSHLQGMSFGHQQIEQSFLVNLITNFNGKRGTVLYVIKISIKLSISTKPKGILSQLLAKIRSIAQIKILTITKIQQDRKISDFIGISKVRIKRFLCKTSKVLTIILLMLPLRGREWPSIRLFQLLIRGF